MARRQGWGFCCRREGHPEGSQGSSTWIHSRPALSVLLPADREKSPVCVARAFLPFLVAHTVGQNYQVQDAASPPLPLS